MSTYRIKKRARSPPREEAPTSEPPGEDAQPVALAAEASAHADQATSGSLTSPALPPLPAPPPYPPACPGDPPVPDGTAHGIPRFGAGGARAGLPPPACRGDPPVPDSSAHVVPPFGASGVRGGGRIPDGWRECSKGGAAIHGLAAVKTPLSEAFDCKLPPEERWTPADCLSACGGSRVGMLIDLTNTRRYYDPARLPSGVRYLKVATEGHALPSDESIQRVLAEIGAMRHARGDQAVAVMHCTHGLNRTGFLLVYALCALDGFSLAEALTAFGQVRPPGLWREQYVRALHDKFGGLLPPLPPPPEWEMDQEKRRH